MRLFSNSSRFGFSLGVLACAALFPLSEPARCWAGMTTNLLANPGGEEGDLTHFQPWVQGGTTQPHEDSASTTFNSDQFSPKTGTYDFVGGRGNLSINDNFGSLTQSIILEDHGITAAEVNTGTLVANVDFWERSYDQGPGNPIDDAYVSLTFLDSSNNQLGMIHKTAVGASVGSWKGISDQFNIPAGTVSIDYTMNFDLRYGFNSNGTVDDNSLIISGLALSAVPAPSSLTLLVIGLCGMIGYGRRRRHLAEC